VVIIVEAAEVVVVDIKVHVVVLVVVNFVKDDNKHFQQTPSSRLYFFFLSQINSLSE
jgi:hypothetical protein